MAILLQIHADQVRHSFENTPQLLPPDRQKLFDLPAGFEEVVSHLRTEPNQLGFILQPLRRTVRLLAGHASVFPIGKFRQEDAHYIIERFGLQLESEELGEYSAISY